MTSSTTTTVDVADLREPSIHWHPDYTGEDWGALSSPFVTFLGSGAVVVQLRARSAEELADWLHSVAAAVQAAETNRLLGAIAGASPLIEDAF